MTSILTWLLCDLLLSCCWSFLVFVFWFCCNWLGFLDQNVTLLCQKFYLQRHGTILCRAHKHSVLVKYFYQSQSSSLLHYTGLKIGISHTQFCMCLTYWYILKKVIVKEDSLSDQEIRLWLKTFFLSFFFFLNVFILLAAIPGIFFSVSVLGKKLEQLTFSSLIAVFRKRVFVASVLFFLFP